MINRIISTNIFFLIAICFGLGQNNKIDFIESISVDQALSLAQQRGKNVFVETYATWCMPCKKLEKVLQDKEIADYFNKNFINVRVNMDNSPHAPEYKDLLGVIFLPTIAIINQTGYIRFKADRVLSKADILSIANKAQNPNTHIHSMVTGMESTPLSNNGIESRGPETILHVIGNDNSNLPSDLARQEAYFRLELMDGSHDLAAKKFLATQKDWSTELNMRFILDFVSDINSKEWEYLITHRPDFDKTIGKDPVDRTIQILVYNHLHQGYPRPTLEEAINYYSLIDAVKCTQWGHQYMLNRTLEDCNFKDYIEIAQYYVTSINKQDHYVMYNLSRFLFDAQNLNDAQKWIESAIKIKNLDIDYLALAAEVFNANGEYNKASEFIEQALKLASKENRNPDVLYIIKNNISEKRAKTKDKK